MPVTANEVNDCKPADVLLVGSSWPDATCQPRQAVCMVRQHHWGLHVCMKGCGQEQASAGSFTTGTSVMRVCLVSQQGLLCKFRSTLLLCAAAGGLEALHSVLYPAGRQPGISLIHSSGC